MRRAACVVKPVDQGVAQELSFTVGDSRDFDL
jgi:hypothetical protein